MCGRIRFSAVVHVHLQNALITASSENVPNSQSSAFRRKYYHLFKQNVLSARIQTNTYINLTGNLLVNIWNHGKNLQDLRCQNHC